MSDKIKIYKRGDKRQDGMVFWAYNPTYTGKNGERWVTPIKFADIKRRHLANSLRRYHSNPAVKNAAVKTAKKWKVKNPERAKAANRKWAVENPHKTAATLALRRQKIKSSLTVNERDLIRLVYATAQRVSKCTGIKFHVDHIMPIALGGPHSISNLQVLPAKINQRKGSKIIPVLP